MCREPDTYAIEVKTAYEFKGVQRPGNGPEQPSPNGFLYLAAIDTQKGWEKKSVFETGAPSVLEPSDDCDCP